ncbi:hypothetical protein BDV93DRAFT_324215 [Ceratobasidium sp. AG-I]|nr:hypothetical protein BDV93DRAFT_324215 [Ceratobasidium sp. AG-I]
MVCAMSADAIRGGIPTLIRTYRVAANQGPHCTIVEAVRATMATPGMFKRAWIEEQTVKTGYVGGGLGCNNPTAHAIDEAELAFPGRSISVVLSVGSGQLRSASVPERRRSSQFLSSNLIEALDSIATDCERTNQELSRRFSRTPNIYFRFNAEQGMQDIDQSDLARLPEVRAHTQNYLKDAIVTTKIDDAARVIATTDGDNRVTEESIRLLRQPGSRIGRCPPPSQIFTGREDILEQMRSYFSDASPPDRHLFVLCGLGGSGKTQLALRFVDIHRALFWDVFYIDATSHQTASAGLSALAKAAKAGETKEAALAWLESQQERWLLVLNNADDPKLNLQQFFPKCKHGDILVTTRNQEMRTHALKRGSFCRVAGMLPKDALVLMRTIAGVEEKEDTASISTTLVEQFGYFALAIVQAGAYMRVTECGLVEYLRIFQKVRAQILQRGLIQQQDDHGLSLFASWEISYRQLSPRPTQLLHILSFLHHEGISEAFFEAASARAAAYKPWIPLTESQLATKSVIFDFLSSLRTPSGEWDPLALKDLTTELRKFSLLDYDTHSSSYSMHPLVQEWGRITAPDRSASHECAAWVLALCVNWAYSSEDYALRRRLLPHLLALDTPHEKMSPELATQLEMVYYEAGYAKEQEALLVIALQASRNALGEEHLTTLIRMGNLAEAFRRQGRLEEAAALLTEVVEVNERAYGSDHPHTLASMHNLALTYYEQNRWQEAEALFLEVIEAKKRVIGADHSLTLKSMGQLASTYWSQGRLTEAGALEAEVLEGMRRVLGREHPDTLMAMHNLAATFREQGKLREAESLMEEAVNLKRKVLGESHVLTQNSIQYLDVIQQNMRSERSPESES